MLVRVPNFNPLSSEFLGAQGLEFETWESTP